VSSPTKYAEKDLQATPVGGASLGRFKADALKVENTSDRDLITSPIRFTGS